MFTIAASCEESTGAAITANSGAFRTLRRVARADIARRPITVNPNRLRTNSPSAVTPNRRTASGSMYVSWKFGEYHSVRYNCIAGLLRVASG
jgi:hypothetical protein